jgi:hypothetical protein
MFELQETPTHLPRSILSWLGAACALAGLYCLVSANRPFGLPTLFFSAGTTLLYIDRLQKQK